MEMRIDMPNWAGIAAQITGRAAGLDAATRAGLELVGELAEHAMVEQLTLRSHPPGTPTPSAPGQPPALITGTLAGSVVTRGPIGAAGRYEMVVGATAEYARIHELGGRTGAGHRTVLPPRPYVHPALIAAQRDMLAVMIRTWRAAMMGT
jgi:phage gpG-like protein